MTTANSLIVLDFETTGLSPDYGDRAIEIGAVRLEGGKVVERFQCLMNPGFRISGFIEDYTGITNTMLAEAEPCSVVMSRFADFIGSSNLVAHNASFDKRFLDSELAQISRSYAGEFACSLLAARRLIQGAPNHKLATLVDYIGAASDGSYHRALYDSEMAAKVWLDMLGGIHTQYQLQDISFSLMKKICKTPKKAVHKLLSTTVAA